MIRVIKLGGSLLQNSAIIACLDVVERLGHQSVIVPGGGAFADQVRIAQNVWRFDDAAAHRMAILAMQQMALLFNSLKPGFPLFSATSDLNRQKRASIWSPDVEELDRAGVAASWDITSDSLAAWLAERVGADELVLVKSADVGADATLAEWQDQSIVDAAFSSYAERLDCPITVINKDRFLSLA